jgi:hypothetical protein
MAILLFAGRHSYVASMSLGLPGRQNRAWGLAGMNHTLEREFYLHAGARPARAVQDDPPA